MNESAPASAQRTHLSCRIDGARDEQRALRYRGSRGANELDRIGIDGAIREQIDARRASLWPHSGAQSASEMSLAVPRSFVG